MLQRTLALLTHDDLEPIVDMVLTHEDGGYDARAADGRVRFRRYDEGHGWRFAVEAVEGRNPLGDQAVDRFVGVDAERAARFPHRSKNAYPFAYEMVSQLFDAPSPPDACVIHSAAHNWEDAGGHRGEHGSLDAVQCRAPFIIAGAGVRALGKVPRACRLVDVAPTVLQLLGAAPAPDGRGLNGSPRSDAFLRRQDGEPQLDVIDASEKPRTLVGFLLDGANPNVLYRMAERGEAPNVARLMAMGTTFEFGAVASLPTVTLANHTSILTGAHPGHHEILHNAWYDRASGRQVITNSPATWATAMQWLGSNVDTIHSAVRRTWPDDLSVSINEPCDAFASWSTFEVLRRGEMIERPPAPDELPHATQRFVRPSKDYRWSSRIDHTSVEQASGIWSGRYRGEDMSRPRFMWVNFTLTDAAFHEGGPHSEVAAASVRDTDARIGEVLAAVERAGAMDDTAFFLVADHGMEETNPDVRGDWGDALRAAEIPFRDEAFGFLYLGQE
jgi:arylsulfatase A-like enzyme